MAERAHQVLGESPHVDLGEVELLKARTAPREVDDSRQSRARRIVCAGKDPTLLGAEGREPGPRSAESREVVVGDRRFGGGGGEVEGGDVREREEGLEIFHETVAAGRSQLAKREDGEGGER